MAAVLAVVGGLSVWDGAAGYLSVGHYRYLVYLGFRVRDFWRLVVMVLAIEMVAWVAASVVLLAGARVWWQGAVGVLVVAAVTGCLVPWARIKWLGHLASSGFRGRRISSWGRFPTGTTRAVFAKDVVCAGRFGMAASVVFLLVVVLFLRQVVAGLGGFWLACAVAGFWLSWLLFGTEDGATARHYRLRYQLSFKRLVRIKAAPVLVMLAVGFMAVGAAVAVCCLWVFAEWVDATSSLDDLLCLAVFVVAVVPGAILILAGLARRNLRLRRREHAGC